MKAMMVNSKELNFVVDSNRIESKSFLTKDSKLNWFSLLREFVSDPDRKSVPRVILEIIYLTLLHSEFPRHYFSRYLFKKKTINISGYLPNKFLYAVKSEFNEQRLREVLDNKLYFDFY